MTLHQGPPRFRLGVERIIVKIYQNTPCHILICTKFISTNAHSQQQNFDGCQPDFLLWFKVDSQPEFMCSSGSRVDSQPEFMCSSGSRDDSQPEFMCSSGSRDDSQQEFMCWSKGRLPAGIHVQLRFKGQLPAGFHLQGTFKG